MHLRSPGVKLRKFSIRIPKLVLGKLKFDKSVHHSRHHRSHYGTYDEDPYYHNSCLGYHSYDDVNSYSHRHYARTHGYRPIVSTKKSSDSEQEEVTYDSLRVTLPPDSPNFCFIPLTTLSMCGTDDEIEAKKTDNFDATSKVIGVLSRPYSVDQSSMADLFSTAKDLLTTSGILLRGMDDPEDNGWYIPDWLCYGCIVGKSKQQRMDDFVEQELEETADEIVALWNKNAKISARGISMSFVDIGDVFSGFTLEVLPYVKAPDSALSGGGTMVANPHFFVAPSAPPLTVSPKEVKTMELMSQTARGDRVDEEEYDKVFNDAVVELNTHEEEYAESYAPFLVDVPPGVFAGGLITVQSPDNLLYSVSVPEGAPPGTTLLVTPGNLEQSDVTATIYTTSSMESPPTYAQSFYHANTIDENDTTIPPPYSPSEFSALPPPPPY